MGGYGGYGGGYGGYGGGVSSQRVSYINPFRSKGVCCCLCFLPLIFV